MTIIDVLKIYDGSDGDATRALYARLSALGPIGDIAVDLFRAQKASARAKVYRGGGFKDKAYDKKQWSIDNLAEILRQHGATFAIRWGWSEDRAQEFHRWVLYVDLPAGQVSFHVAARGDGPAYAGEWDRIRDASAGRICSWIAKLLAEKVSA